MRLVTSQRLTDDAAVIGLSGDLDLATAPELRTALHEALTERAKIVVDMSDLRFLDSTGLGVLVRVHKKAKAAGGVVAFTSVPGNVVKILEVTCLDRVFPVYDTVDEALADDTGPEPGTDQSAD
ncbi:MAG: anti-sigma factor antagonist [Micromonosporaceae bacterium]|nr:anti-sigma factor antagonist [Micromonosporaceae bacterium]